MRAERQGPCVYVTYHVSYMARRSYARRQMFHPSRSNPGGNKQARRPDPWRTGTLPETVARWRRKQLPQALRTPNQAQQRAQRKAGATGLEPATSGVTGRRSNQLSYAPWKGDPQYAKGNLKASSGRNFRAAGGLGGFASGHRTRAQPGRGLGSVMTDGGDSRSRVPAVFRGRWRERTVGSSRRRRARAPGPRRSIRGRGRCRLRPEHPAADRRVTDPEGPRLPGRRRG